MWIKLGIVVGVGLLVSLFVLYNGKIKSKFLTTVDRVDKSVSSTVGRRIKDKHDKLEANASINKGSFYNTITRFYDDILVHLGFKKSGVNVLSFVIFIIMMSLTLSFVTVLFLKDILLTIVLIGVYFLLITVVFKFMALTKYETIESMLMEAEDLIAMGVDEGVKNAITRYTPSLHPSIRPYFETFLHNIDREGYSFKDAMAKLNDDLGDSFNSFARAAIEYEEKGDSKTKEVFSPLVDENEVKRDMRETGKRAFAQIRMFFGISVVLTASFGAYLILSERSAYELFIENSIGRIVLVVDGVIVLLVLAFITTIKARLIR